MELCKQSKSFKTMWAMIQIKEDIEMFYNFQRYCNAKLGNANYIFIRGQNQYSEHQFACSFYFYFDNFKKHKKRLHLWVPLSSTLNSEKKIDM